jgi:hypothetical protein
MPNITKIREVILFTYLALAFVDALPMANLAHAENKGQDTEEKRRKSNPLVRIREENRKKRICRSESEENRTAKKIHFQTVGKRTISARCSQYPTIHQFLNENTGTCDCSNDIESG